MNVRYSTEHSTVLSCAGYGAWCMYDATYVSKKCCDSLHASLRAYVWMCVYGMYYSNLAVTSPTKPYKFGYRATSSIGRAHA